MLDISQKAAGGLGGVNLRLAQFYKDVELAEVLTDNDPQVEWCSPVVPH